MFLKNVNMYFTVERNERISSPVLLRTNRARRMTRMKW